MPIDWSQIEPLLLEVERPGRYVGGEFNQVVKLEAEVRCCLAFPDVYEIGMSHHGTRVLYERINQRPEWAAERSYAPWPDFEQALRRTGVPLYSLETRRGMGEFDWIGFTLQHELNSTNVLNMLELGGVPVRSADRTEAHPVVIGGGAGAWSPEPMAPFIDAFALGDGETLVEELMEVFAQAGREGWDRQQVLEVLDAKEGLYVPAFFEARYSSDGRVREILRQDGAEANRRPQLEPRRYRIGADHGVRRPVVPLLRTVHDRLVIEVRRGCVNGCRFCQAGMLGRPVSERSIEQIVEVARAGLEATGYDKISLLSLSAADYTQVVPLVRRLHQTFGDRGISVSLPSIRINSFDVALADELSSVRKSGLTFAPEAGTERLRRVINKPVDQQVLYQIVEDVFRRGWRTLKLYFMIGLPTETEADLVGIVTTTARVAQIGRRIHGKRARVNVTISPFVPKAHTPFQWEGQPGREELRRRNKFVWEGIRRRCGRTVDTKTRNLATSWLEAILARGDRRLAEVIEQAWRWGARLDNWSEWFNASVWERAFETAGLDPAFYANRKRDPQEIMPYEHIRSVAGRRFLWRERERAGEQSWLEPCDKGPCAGCEACGPSVRHDPAPEVAALPEAPQPTKRGASTHEAPEPVVRMRLCFSRLGPLRYLSHLDFGKVLLLILRRAELPLAYSRGFNPQPRVQYGPPLSVGTGGERELLDILLTHRVEPADVIGRLNAIPLEGLHFLGAVPVALRADSLEKSILASVYRLTFPDRVHAGSREAQIRQRIEEYDSKASWPIQIEHKKGPRQVDLKTSVGRLRMVEAPDTDAAGLALELEITHEPGRYIKPSVAAGHLLRQDLKPGRGVRITRTRMKLRDETHDTATMYAK